MFYNGLNEQRHLTGVMVGLETDPALRKFLETNQGPVGSTLRESRGAIEPPRFHSVSCAVSRGGLDGFLRRRLVDRLLNSWPHLASD